MRGYLETPVNFSQRREESKFQYLRINKQLINSPKPNGKNTYINGIDEMNYFLSCRTGIQSKIEP